MPACNWGQYDAFGTGAADDILLNCLTGPELIAKVDREDWDESQDLKVYPTAVLRAAR